MSSLDIYNAHNNQHPELGDRFNSAFFELLDDFVGASKAHGDSESSTQCHQQVSTQCTGPLPLWDCESDPSEPPTELLSASSSDDGSEEDELKFFSVLNAIDTPALEVAPVLSCPPQLQQQRAGNKKLGDARSKQLRPLTMQSPLEERPETRASRRRGRAMRRSRQPSTDTPVAAVERVKREDEDIGDAHARQHFTSVSLSTVDNWWSSPIADSETESVASPASLEEGPSSEPEVDQYVPIKFRDFVCLKARERKALAIERGFSTAELRELKAETRKFQQRMHKKKIRDTHAHVEKTLRGEVATLKRKTADQHLSILALSADLQLALTHIAQHTLSPGSAFAPAAADDSDIRTLLGKYSITAQTLSSS